MRFLILFLFFLLPCLNSQADLPQENPARVFFSPLPEGEVDCEAKRSQAGEGEILCAKSNKTAAFMGLLSHNFLPSPDPSGRPLPQGEVKFSTSTNPPITTYTCPVTATPLYDETKTGESTTITRDEIERKQNIFVQDILRDAPSIHISNTGDNGRQTRFAIRGAIGGENLVLIDGIPVNDPAASSGLFDFADLLSDDIETVTILPGTNTVHYGADAMGGVIHLTTVSGKGTFALQGKIEGGSHQTSKGRLAIGGEHKDLALHGTFSGYSSGSGTFLNKVHLNPQSDRYRNALGSGKLSYALSPDHEVELGIRNSHACLKFDEIKPCQDLYLPFAADNFQRSQHRLHYLRYQGGFCDNRYETELTLSHNRTNRHVKTHHLPFSTNGDSHRLHTKLGLNWCDTHKTTLGGELDHNRIKDFLGSKYGRHHQGFFAEHLYKPTEKTELSAGSRLDGYDGLSERATYRFAAGHLIGTTRLRASYGTGFKAPLLSDMYNVSTHVLPNPNLQPENNHSYDVGLDQKMGEKTELNLTYFTNHIEKVFLTELLPGFIFQRVNGGTRKAQGVEAKLQVHISKQWQVNTNATWTRAFDINLVERKKSPHIPKLQLNNEVIVSPEACSTFSLSSHFVTRQRDGITSLILPSFTVFDLKASTDWRGVTFYGRIENLTDKRYEQTYGYGVRGRSYYLGISV